MASRGAVDEIEIESGVDFYDRPAYHFSFLIDQKGSKNRQGLVLTRQRQRLADDLDARGDTHIPTIRLLDREDWGRRGNA